MSSVNGMSSKPLLKTLEPEVHNCIFAVGGLDILIEWLFLSSVLGHAIHSEKYSNDDLALVLKDKMAIMSPTDNLTIIPMP